MYSHTPSVHERDIAHHCMVELFSSGNHIFMKKITLNKEIDNFALSILSNVKVATAIVKCAAWYFYNFILFIY